MESTMAFVNSTSGVTVDDLMASVSVLRRACNSVRAVLCCLSYMMRCDVMHFSLTTQLISAETRV